jgi:mono/diheme cytochrome c family protein
VNCWSAACAAWMVVMLMVSGGCDRLPGRPKEEDRPVRPGKVTDFVLLYRQNCAGCHGFEGQPGAAVALSNPVYLALVDDTTLRRVITQGIPGTAMPAFALSAGGTLTDEQIEILIREMHARWTRPDALGRSAPPPYSAATTSGDAQRGAEVYATFCSSCHGPGGVGGPRGGSIVEGSYLALVSDQGLRTAVIVGRPELGMPDWRSYVPDRPMTVQEISDAVAWLAGQRLAFPGQPSTRAR